MYQFWIPVLEVVDSCLHNCFRILACCMCIKSDKFRFRHLSNGRCCDEFCVETFAKRSKSREDTLNVNNDRFTGACQNHVFLLQEVTSHRNSTTHSYFIGSTANTRNSNSLCAFFFCVSNHFRIVCIFTDHLRK